MPELIAPHYKVLTPMQAQVIELISTGNTISQIGRQLSVPGEEITAARTDIIAGFGVKGIAHAVGLAIESNELPIDRLQDDETVARLGDVGARLLRFYARGGTNEQLKNITKTPKDKVESIHDTLLLRAKAWSRAHAVRRGYELGLIVPINPERN